MISDEELEEIEDDLQTIPDGIQEALFHQHAKRLFKQLRTTSAINKEFREALEDIAKADNFERNQDKPFVYGMWSTSNNEAKKARSALEAETKIRGCENE